MIACKKCGNDFRINLIYDNESDKLNGSCSQCGYKWQQDTVDKTVQKPTGNSGLIFGLVFGAFIAAAIATIVIAAS